MKFITLPLLALTLLAPQHSLAAGYAQLMRNPVLEMQDMERISKIAVPHETKKLSINKTNDDLKKKKIAKKSKELEGVFLAVMMEPMFPKHENSDLYGGREGASVFRTMMIQQYGKAFADAGGIGLSSGIAKQIEGRN